MDVLGHALRMALSICLGYLACCIPSAKDAYCFSVTIFSLNRKSFFMYSCEYPRVSSVSFGICCDTAVSCEVRVLRIYRDQIARPISLAAVSVYSSCVCCIDNMICKELLPVES